MRTHDDLSKPVDLAVWRQYMEGCLTLRDVAERIELSEEAAERWLKARLLEWQADGSPSWRGRRSRRRLSAEAIYRRLMES